MIVHEVTLKSTIVKVFSLLLTLGRHIDITMLTKPAS